MARKQEEVARRTEKNLTEEIKRILERNQNEKFLRKLLTRAIILASMRRAVSDFRHSSMFCVAAVMGAAYF